MSPAALLTTLLVCVMLVQSLLGLVLADQYRDVEWIRATWQGNDWITLVAATPLLFGATLNAFLPLYVLGLLLGLATLGAVLPRIDVDAVARSFRRRTPARLIGGYLAFVGTGLAAVWLGMWGAHVFAGHPTPVAPEAFKVVAALDLSLLVPSLVAGGLLLWKREPWGYVVAAIAALQGALYLVVLTLNSAIAIGRGLVAAPGELPIWGTLAVLTTAAAVLLLANSAGAFDWEVHRTTG